MYMKTIYSNLKYFLDEANIQAENDSNRLSHDEIFSAIRARIKDKTEKTSTHNYKTK